jgi:hypothetical protein
MRRRAHAIKGRQLICDLAVGPLPQHSPHPQHSRRVFRCDLLCPALQAQVVAGVHRSWFRCWTGLGGVRLCKSCLVSRAIARTSKDIRQSCHVSGHSDYCLQAPCCCCCFLLRPVLLQRLSNADEKCNRASSAHLPPPATAFALSLAALLPLLERLAIRAMRLGDEKLVSERATMVRGATSTSLEGRLQRREPAHVCWTVYI